MSKRRLEFDGWPRGLLEDAVGDSSRLDRQSLAAARNVRFDAAGGLTMRAGVSRRGPALPSVASHLFPYEKGEKRAVIESDGDAIRVAVRGGWTEVGAFAAPGSVIDGVVIDGRLYLVNGLTWRVVEWGGAAWDVRAPGVAAPAATLSPSASGGSSPTTCTLFFALCKIDDRGFKSNVGNAVRITGVKIDDTVTVAGLPTDGGTYELYGSKRDQRTLYYLKSLPDNVSASTTVDTLDSSRIDSITAPEDNDPPPDGAVAVALHKRRLYAALDDYYFFAQFDEPEYWPADNVAECAFSGDTSPIWNFEPASAGLLLLKRGGFYLLDRDPQYEGDASPVMAGRGLVAPGACASADGTVIAVTQDGLVAHDGVRGVDLFQRVAASSEMLVGAVRVHALARGGLLSLLCADPDAYDAVRALNYEPERRIFHTDSYVLDVASSGVSPRIDLLVATAVDAYENLAESAPTISAGGGTTTVTLSGPVSAHAVADCAIQFVGGSPIAVVSVAGAESTPIIELADAAPADGTAVEWLRGVELSGGAVCLTSGAGYAAGAFRAEMKPESAITSFVAFNDQPVTVSGELPSGTDLRFGFRFAAGGDIREFTGRDWAPVFARPALANADGMTLAAVNDLTPDDLVRSGGLDPDAPYLQLVVWALGDGSATPRLTGVMFRYITGTRPVVETMTLTAAVPLSGPEIVDASGELPAGSYLCNTEGSFRVDDGEDDDGAAIVAEARLQETIAGGEADFHGVELDVSCDADSAMFEVEPIVGGRSLATVAQRVTSGRGKYVVRFGRVPVGLTLAATIRWRERGAALIGAALVVEPRGRSGPR